LKVFTFVDPPSKTIPASGSQNGIPHTISVFGAGEQGSTLFTFVRGTGEMTKQDEPCYGDLITDRKKETEIGRD
jgi:hypothetical protein